MRNFLFLFVFLLFSFSLQSQSRSNLYLQYVEDYKEIAIDNMKRFRIPASITLAQGLLESGAGQGTLAKKSNNHFGIKCHDWTGKKTYHDDDARGECFRYYSDPRESYSDHSRFLTERKRYAPLFELDIFDYKGWARGLSRCGYATDPAYASKLIQLIENYELFAYDRYKGSSKPSKSQQKEYKHAQQTGRAAYISWGLLYVEARAGETLKEISKAVDISPRRLARYNDDIPQDMSLSEGDIVYLQRKNSKAKKPFKLHMIVAGESMFSIAQRFGIRLDRLYRINKKNSDYTPSVGDVLKLR